MNSNGHPLYQILRRGKQNAVKSCEIALRMDVPEREVRDVVRGFRRTETRELLCGDSGGYYFAATIGEMDNQIRHYRSRAIDILDTLSRMKVARAERVSQMLEESSERQFSIFGGTR